MARLVALFGAPLFAIICVVHPVMATANDSPADKHAQVDTSMSTTVADIVFKAVSMIGTRYQRGGQSPEAGFDCSGFVRYVFAQTLQRDLPRTSAEMGAIGESVARDGLQPGDLVFYNTLRRAFSHVGIYIGDGRFVHAPSRGRRVEIVDMSVRYWQRRYNGARRLAELGTSSVELVGPVAEPPSETSPTEGSR